MTSEEDPIVIIGGGIAGVTCATTLAELCPDRQILVISASPLLKTVTNLTFKGVYLESFGVSEVPSESITDKHPNIKVKNGLVTGLDSPGRTIILENGSAEKYSKLCICSGARPELIPGASSFPDYVIGIRDTQSVKELQEKLTNSRRVLIVGNGGIATELAHEVSGVEIFWVIKDKHIGNTFFDAGVANFFVQSLHSEQNESSMDPLGMRRRKYTIDPTSQSDANTVIGSALGPDWTIGLELRGSSSVQKDNFQLEKECTVEEIYSQDSDEKWPIFVKLSNGKVYGCDLMISATGVKPNVEPFTSNNNFTLGPDNGICVDETLRTSISDIWAAGDACYANWKWSDNWIQMRLWTQARQMGFYAAQCIAASLNSDPDTAKLYFNFDVFTHITKFFNYKVVLLGLFNGQNLDYKYSILLRETPNKEYVKLVISGGRVRGAIFVGETDLEETFENLIHNAIDVSSYGDDLLNPSIDIEDYFD